MEFDTIKRIIVEQLGVKEKDIQPNSSFVEDLGADSLEIVELVMAFESEFGLEIPDEDVEVMVTVEDAFNYIKEHSEI